MCTKGPALEIVEKSTLRQDLQAKFRLGQSASCEQRKFLPPKLPFLLVALRSSFQKLHLSIRYDQIEHPPILHFKYGVPATLSSPAQRKMIGDRQQTHIALTLRGSLCDLVNIENNEVEQITFARRELS